MKYILSLFLIAALLTGCKKDNSFCGYKDPINEIAWLNDYVTNEAIIHCDVYQAIYKDTSGFYLITYTDSLRKNRGTSFTTCDGIGICQTGGFMPPQCPDYIQHESYRELIYSR